MTSSIIQSNYNLNSIVTTNTTTNNTNSNTNNFNSNTINRRISNKTPSANHLHHHSTKAQNNSTNLIYNIKNAVMESKYFKNISNNVDNNNNNNNNNNNISNYHNNSSTINNTSASLALMNKIRAIESRKKRTNIPTSAHPTSIVNNNTNGNINMNMNNYSNNTYQQQTSGAHNSKATISNNNLEYELSANDLLQHKPINSSTPTPMAPMQTSIEINKLRRKFNRAQNESMRNSDHYKDRLTDQKFFDRNYKLTDQTSLTQGGPGMITGTGMMVHVASVTPTASFSNTAKGNSNNMESSDGDLYFNAIENQKPGVKHVPTNAINNQNSAAVTPTSVLNTVSPSLGQTNNIANNATSNTHTNVFNRLKLLKKRNLNKKNANAAAASPNHLTKSQSNMGSLSKFTDIDVDIDDLDDDNGPSYKSNHIPDHHKSNQTVDESYLYEIKKKSSKIDSKINSSTTNINNKSATRSTTALYNSQNYFSPTATPSQKAKSDNCLLELVDKSINGQENKLGKNKNQVKEDLFPKFNDALTATGKKLNSDTKLNMDGLKRFMPTNAARSTNHSKAPQTTLIATPAYTYTQARESTGFIKNTQNERLFKQKTDVNLKQSQIRTEVKSARRPANVPSKYNTPADKYDEYSSDSSFDDNDNNKNYNNQRTSTARKPNERVNNENINPNINNINIETAKPQQQNEPFKIIYPGCINNEIMKPSKTGVKAVGGEDYYENDENIFDNNFINEEFKRLFQEDEYFKEIHRKCSEWLLKHVIPNMPKIQAKLKKHHKIVSN